MQKVLKYLTETDFLILLISSLGFFILLSFDINSWYYSAIGDEYGFYDWAKGIATNQIHPSIIPADGQVSIFSSKGVYDIAPVASSLYQATVMKIFGINHAGWIISNIIIVIFSSWFFYFLIKTLLGKNEAIISLIFFLSSHLLWAFTHLGYWNIQVYFPFLGALFFFFKGIRGKNIFFPFMAGIFLSLGFYTPYLSLLAIFLVFSYLILNIREFIATKRFILFLLLGFFILFIPYLLINRSILFAIFSRHSITTQDSMAFLSLFFENIRISLLALYQNPTIQHYISGSLIDPIAGLFFALGFIFMLYRFKRYYFFILWFTSAVVLSGGFSPHRSVPITRLIFILPIVSAISGYGLTKFSFLAKKLLPLLFQKTLVVLILAIVISLNPIRFYRQTPQKLHLTTEAVTIGALNNFPACNQQAVIVFESYEGLLKPALESYNPTGNIIYLKDPDLLLNLKDTTCIVFSEPNNYTSDIQKLIETEGFSIKGFSSQSKNRLVTILLRNKQPLPSNTFRDSILK